MFSPDFHYERSDGANRKSFFGKEFHKKPIFSRVHILHREVIPSLPCACGCGVWTPNGTELWFRAMGKQGPVCGCGAFIFFCCGTMFLVHAFPSQLFLRSSHRTSARHSCRWVYNWSKVGKNTKGQRHMKCTHWIQPGGSSCSEQQIHLSGPSKNRTPFLWLMYRRQNWAFVIVHGFSTAHPTPRPQKTVKGFLLFSCLSMWNHTFFFHLKSHGQLACEFDAQFVSFA